MKISNKINLYGFKNSDLKQFDLANIEFLIGKGLIQNKVIHFADDEEEGKELELSQFEKVLVANEDEIEIPIFEEQDVRKDVPYISFDENGDEITKYREVIRKQKVQVGMKKEMRSVIDVKAFNNIYEYCYKKLHEYLSTLFPLEQIVKV